MTQHQQIAQEIMNQLGGRIFTTFCGVKNPMSHNDGLGALSFRLPGNPGFVKEGINYIKVTLDPSDTYNVEFGRVHGHKYTVKHTHTNVYCDELATLIQERTGLYWPAPRFG